MLCTLPFSPCYTLFSEPSRSPATDSLVPCVVFTSPVAILLCSSVCVLFMYYINSVLHILSLNHAEVTWNVTDGLYCKVWLLRKWVYTCVGATVYRNLKVSSRDSKLQIPHVLIVHLYWIV